MDRVAKENIVEIVDDKDVPHDACAAESWLNEDDLSLDSGPGRWRKAKALVKLKAQVDAEYPNRNGPDGFIGDKRHCPGPGWTGKSDHCLNIVADGLGIVTAVDMKHEPENGCDIGVVVDAIRKSRDSRIKYIIWNKRICSSKKVDGTDAWAWRSYAGAPHDKHAHFSVLGDANLFDEKGAWKIK